MPLNTFWFPQVEEVVTHFIDVSIGVTFPTSSSHINKLFLGEKKNSLFFLSLNIMQKKNLICTERRRKKRVFTKTLIFFMRREKTESDL